MNIDKVNATMAKAINHIQGGEIEDLRTIAMDAVESDDGSDRSGYDAYIDKLAAKVADQAGIDEDQAIEAIVAVAGSKADARELPEMPDSDQASEKDLSHWTEAAKRSGLGDAVIEACKAAI